MRAAGSDDTIRLTPPRTFTLEEALEFIDDDELVEVTPDDIRRRGGALFCERRYGTVFTFHNGADSYYSVRGWRGFITV